MSGELCHVLVTRVCRTELKTNINRPDVPEVEHVCNSHCRAAPSTSLAVYICLRKRQDRETARQTDTERERETERDRQSAQKGRKLAGLEGRKEGRKESERGSKSQNAGLRLWIVLFANLWFGPLPSGASGWPAPAYCLPPCSGTLCRDLVIYLIPFLLSFF